MEAAVYRRALPEGWVRPALVHLRCAVDGGATLAKSGEVCVRVPVCVCGTFHVKHIASSGRA